MKLPIHAGAKTALQLQGYSHFLAMGKGGTVSLFGSPPGSGNMFGGVALRYDATKVFADDPNAGLTQKELAAYAIIVSAPERAIMEVLYLLPA